MQYILTQDEYDDLGPLTDYADLESSVRMASEKIAKAYCLRKKDKRAYCDNCPLAKISYKERYGRRDLCQLPKYFSK